MKKKFFVCLFCVSQPLFSSIKSQDDTIDCILVKQKDQILLQEGNHCKEPYSPNSTFKIPLAMMGFESGFLKGPHEPRWTSDKPVMFLPYYHGGEHTPSSWMRFSVVWYSQMLTQKLGMNKFKEYLNKLNYGNKDVSGGLTEAWLSSSLKISPIEQLEFIEKLAKNEHSIEKSSQEKTKDLLKLLEESSLFHWWSMHGKTGSGSFDQLKRKEGYFVGYGEKNKEIISFVIHMSGKHGDKASPIGGIYAKKVLFERMKNLDLYKISPK